MKILLFLVMTLLLTACGPSPERAVRFAEQVISNNMRDPDSAKFSDSKFYEKNGSSKDDLSGYVCGHVNGKNSFGGYTGNTRFIVLVRVTKSGDGYGPPLIGESEILDAAWDENCHPSS